MSQSRIDELIAEIRNQSKLLEDCHEEIKKQTTQIQLLLEEVDTINYKLDFSNENTNTLVHQIQGYYARPIPQKRPKNVVSEARKQVEHSIKLFNSIDRGSIEQFS